MLLRRFIGGLAAALVLVSAWTQAGAACPDESDSDFANYSLADYQQHLQQFAERCARDPAYLAWHGVVLKWQGQYAQAAELLELALMRAPQRLGTRIDYADVLAAMGDFDAGRALISSLLAEPDLPANLRPLLEARLRDWRSDAWLAKAFVTTRAGYDSNLNSATRARELSLTLPEGEVGLILAPGSRARPGAFMGLELAGDAERRISGRDTIQVLVDIRNRLSSESDTDYLQGELNGIWRRRDIDDEHQWLLGAGNLAYDGHSLYRMMRMGYSREGRQGRRLASLPGAWMLGGMAERLGDCHPRLGGELEFRSYPALSLLDNTLVAAQFGYACHGEEAFRAQIRVGRELAAADRPGGDAWRIDGRMIWRRAFARGWLETDLSLAVQRDDQAYSSLLADGARRHIERFGLRLEYQQLLARQWLGVVTFDLGKQNSNIELFDVRSGAFSLGARYAF